MTSCDKVWLAIQIAYWVFWGSVALVSVFGMGYSAAKFNSYRRAK